RRLIAASFFLEDRHQLPSREGFARHLVHADPEGRFLVAAGVWLPQQSTPVHDHATWGVIAALTNRVLITGFRRVDDATTPGFASIGEVSRTLVSDTSIAAVRPPDEDIHRIENPFRDAAV